MKLFWICLSSLSEQNKKGGNISKIFAKGIYEHKENMGDYMYMSLSCRLWKCNG